MSGSQEVLREVLERGFFLIPTSPCSVFARLGTGNGGSTARAGAFGAVTPGRYEG